MGDQRAEAFTAVPVHAVGTAPPVDDGEIVEVLSHAPGPDAEGGRRRPGAPDARSRLGSGDVIAPVALDADRVVHGIPCAPERVEFAAADIPSAVEQAVVVARPVDIKAVLAAIGDEGVAGAYVEPVRTVIVGYAKGRRVGVGSAADPAGGLDQRDLEATLHERFRRAQSRRASADHDHVGVDRNLRVEVARCDQGRPKTGEKTATADAGLAIAVHGSDSLCFCDADYLHAT